MGADPPNIFKGDFDRWGNTATMIIFLEVLHQTTYITTEKQLQFFLIGDFLVYDENLNFT